MDSKVLEDDPVLAARKEVGDAGYEELTTPESVDEALNREGSTLVLVNSTCKCTGTVARPAATSVADYDNLPDHLVSVFAGQDNEATARAREYFDGQPPSSPSFALLKDGKLATMIERSNMKGYSVDNVVGKLQQAFDDHLKEA